jgi:hypothetical protein
MHGIQTIKRLNGTDQALVNKIVAETLAQKSPAGDYPTSVALERAVEELKAKQQQ